MILLHILDVYFLPVDPDGSNEGEGTEEVDVGVEGLEGVAPVELEPAGPDPQVCYPHQHCL